MKTKWKVIIAVILAVVSNVWTILAIENFHLIVLIENFEMALLFGFALFLDQFDGSIQGDGQWIILLWNRNILAVMEDVTEDFAIAEFVDSSKLELQRIVRQGLDILRKENA